MSAGGAHFVADVVQGAIPRVVVLFVRPRPLGTALQRNARFPLGPSAIAFALNSWGSILVNTGPALRDLAVRLQQVEAIR